LRRRPDRLPQAPQAARRRVRALAAQARPPARPHRDLARGRRRGHPRARPRPADGPPARLPDLLPGQGQAVRVRGGEGPPAAGAARREEPRPQAHQRWWAGQPVRVRGGVLDVRRAAGGVVIMPGINSREYSRYSRKRCKETHAETHAAHGNRQTGRSGTHAETHAAHGHSPYKLTANTHAETHAAHGFRVSAGQKLTRNSRGLLTHPLSLKREEGVRPPANATGPPTTPAATPPPEATPTPPPNPRS